MAKTKKFKLSKLERAVNSRAKHIEKLVLRKQRIRRFAEEDCARVDILLSRAQVLLDALKDGRLKV